MEVVIPLPENFSREKKIKYSNRERFLPHRICPPPPPLEKKKKLGYAARREFRVWAIFQQSPLVSRFTPGGFSINFFSQVYIYRSDESHFDHFVSRVRSFFPSCSHFPFNFLFNDNE